MPTNNPNQQTSSQPTPRGAADAASDRIEQGGKRIEGKIERLEKTAEEAANSAIERVRAAREQATSGINQQRDQIAHRIQKVGEVLRSGSDLLQTDDPLAHEVLTYVSQRADGLAAYVRDATPGSVADDLHAFARRRPGVFFGGAFLVGLALGRFVKASTSSVGGGGDRSDIERYGDAGYDAADLEDSSYGGVRERSAVAVAPTYAAPSYTGPSSASATPSAGNTPPSTGTSLPYVSAGNTIGASPSSATYGASTASGTSGGSDDTRPSYGSTTVGGTGGYAAQPSSKAPVITRPSQPPALREVPDEPASPKPHAVREGEGTKS